MSSVHQWIAWLIFSLMIHGWILGMDCTRIPAVGRGNILPVMEAKGGAGGVKSSFCLHQEVVQIDEKGGHVQGETHEGQVLKQFLADVKMEIEAHKFCAIGKRAEMIGNVYYRFAIDKAGYFSNIILVRGSGNPELDRAGRAAIVAADHKIKRPESSGPTVISLGVIIKYQYGL